MKNRCRFFFAILLIVVVFSCRTSEKENIYSIDSQAIFKPVQEIPLSEIAEKVEYIKLETNPDVLLGGGCQILIRDSVIIASPFKTGIYIFDYPTGKFKFKINGYMDRGPLGYTSPSGPLCIDDAGRILLPRWRDMGSWSYLTGNFLHSLPVFPHSYSPLLFINDTLLVGARVSGRPDSDSFLDILSAKTGKITKKLGLYTPEDAKSNHFYAGDFLMEKADDDIVVYFYKCDTIFTVSASGLNLKPRLTLNRKDKLPPKEVTMLKNYDDYINLYSYIETRKWIFPILSYKEQLYYILFNKETGQTVYYQNTGTYDPEKIYGFSNDLDGTVLFRPTYRLNDRQIYNVIDASRFIKNAGEEKAKQMGISEEDNPVIMIVTLK